MTVFDALCACRCTLHRLAASPCISRSASSPLSSMILVGRAGLEPATYGLKEEPVSALDRVSAELCEDGGIRVAMTDAPARTDGSDSANARQAATSATCAAGLLRRELGQLVAGDVAGGVSILEELLFALAAAE